MSNLPTELQTVSTAVANLYNAYPFPPEPILDEPPLGYNWRWHWQAAYSFCTGQKPSRNDVRILDAGCGTGCGTEYLVYLNPEAQVLGIDLSEGALAVAQERCQKLGGDRVAFQPLSLFDVGQLAGEFDLINCVGVLHHTADPVRGIQALASKLAPGGLLHVFVYGELGRWEIQLMQEAIALLQGEQRGDYTDGVAIGRQLFATLPEGNRLKQREQERWAWENQRDACFADMYVHPQEIDYNINTVFELIDTSGLEFAGFSNPHLWSLERLIGQAPELVERAKYLSDKQRYRLIEILDPASVAHYEFFLYRPPLARQTWAEDAVLLAAKPEPSPCIQGWQDSPQFFNYNYQVVTISDLEWQFLLACGVVGEFSAGEAVGAKTVAQLLNTPKLQQLGVGLAEVRSLQQQQVILLTP
jgi:SAM-dependent methyltransferase